MGELRKDYFVDRFSVVEPRRQRKADRASAEEAECEYCAGNEHLTLPADLVLVRDSRSLIKMSDEEGEPVKGWSVRSFPQREPIVTTEPNRAFGDPPLYSEPSFGYHYIIVSTPDHDTPFSKIDIEQWVDVLICLQDKARWLYAKKGVSYVSMYVNYTGSDGEENNHPRINLVTLPRIPPIIESEANAVHQSISDYGICPMCRVLNVEAGGPRQLLSTDLFLAFTPWASTCPYEFWIFPKKHQTSILKATQIELENLALILRSCLGGLSKALRDPAFTLVFHTSSEKKTTKQIHWHIEVYPKTGSGSGLELASGIYDNEVSPERASEVLGVASRREFSDLLGVT